MGKYLMWGVFPVYIAKDRSWKPAVSGKLSKVTVSACIVTLALLNRFVEKVSMGWVDMGIPIVPMDSCKRSMGRAYD